MVNLELAAWTIAFVCGCLLIVSLIMGLGYAAFSVRTTRNEVRRRAQQPGPDPVMELASINDQLAKELLRANAHLEGTRAAVKKGIEG